MFKHCAVRYFCSVHMGEELYMTVDMRNKLVIEEIRLKEINDFLIDPNNKLVNDLFAVVDKYGGPEEINRKATEARNIDNLMGRLREKNSIFVKDLEWLIEQRDNGAFISVDEYRKKILGDKAEGMDFNENFSVTLEISACQYFNAFMEQTHQALENN